MADLQAVLVESRGLIARSPRLCRTARPICGGSDPEPARQAAPTTQNDALWQFLESHRGQMFCTLCIATALFATKRIDRAVLGAEGRGARRQYGTCASCGKERLLCGLMG